MPKTRMRVRREALGLLLTEVSAAAGVPYATAHAIESGRGLNFNPMTKVKLAEALKAEPLDLFPELAGRVDHESGRGYFIIGR